MYQNVIFTMTVNMVRPNPLAKIILIRFDKKKLNIFTEFDFRKSFCIHY